MKKKNKAKRKNNTGLRVSFVGESCRIECVGDGQTICPECAEWAEWMESLRQVPYQRTNG